MRTTLFAIDGHWGEWTVSDLIVTAYHQDKQVPSPICIGTSTWQRSSDVSLPARIKTGTNYQVARLARIEGRARGCQEMVLLNQWGRVAEATGSCVLMVREGTIYSPPPTEGALELSEESPLLRALQSRYFEAVRGINPHPVVELSLLLS